MSDEIYESEKEQIETIKKWLRENGPAILLGLVLGISSISGWRYWQAYQQRQSELASASYENMQVALRNGKLADAEKTAADLIAQHRSRGYAAFAAFTLAKIAVDKKDFAAAEKHLQWVIDSRMLPELKNTARLRLARVLLANNQSDAAWRQIQAIGEHIISPALLEVKGDVLAAQGKVGEARKAYENALAEAALSNPAIDKNETSAAIKLASLPASTPASGSAGAQP